MILIACIDDQMGMAFNRRRQSRDQILTERVKDFSEYGILWTDPYTAKLFDYNPNIKVSQECLGKAGQGEYCFVETQDPLPFENRIEKIILYRWNRRYPASLRFQINLSRWKCTSTKEFAGFSHEKITEEVYVPCATK